MPTSVTLDVPPAGSPAAGADAYECYRVGVAEGAPGFPAGTQVLVADGFETRRYVLRRPRRLCLPVDTNGAGITNPRAHLLCYEVARAADEPRHTPIVGRLHTANALDAGQRDTVGPRELCVPALREPCGFLPPCVSMVHQSADCLYDPAVTDPAHRFCSGPRILVDAAHRNFHLIEEGQVAGRWWGFTRLLLNDGYDVQQTAESPSSVLGASDTAVFVIANPETEPSAGPDAEAVPARDVKAIVDWVRAGGSLLLVIDHEPRERAGPC